MRDTVIRKNPLFNNFPRDFPEARNNEKKEERKEEEEEEEKKRAIQGIRFPANESKLSSYTRMIEKFPSTSPRRFN